MQNKIKYAIFAGLIAGSLFTVKPALAQSYSSNQSNFSVSVDKKISDLKNSSYFDNIPATQNIFFENDQIDFQITVSNTGKNDLNDLKITDTLPANLTLLFFPGQFNNDNNKIVDNIGTLGVGQSAVFDIRAKVTNTPVTKAVTHFKRTNRVCVSDSNASDCDNASYFIGSETMPNTGNEMIIFQTLMGTGIAGLALGFRKLIRGY